MGMAWLLHVLAGSFAVYLSTMMASVSFSLEEMIIWPEEVSGKDFLAQERLNHLMALHILQ